MFLIERAAVADANLTSSNIVEDDETEYASGTTYSIGDRVRVTADHWVYESLIDNNTGNQPSVQTDDDNWASVGATNRWKAFDDRPSSPVVGDLGIDSGTISYELTATEDTDTFSFFNVQGTELRIEVDDPGGVRRNELTYTRSLTRPPWVIDGVATEGTENGAYGDNTVLVLRTNGTSLDPAISHSLSLGAGTYTASVSLKKENTLPHQVVIVGTFEDGSTFCAVNVDPANGTIEHASGAEPNSIRIMDDVQDPEFVRVYVTVVATTVTFLRFRVVRNNDDSDIYMRITAPQFEQSGQDTIYQEIPTDGTTFDTRTFYRTYDLVDTTEVVDYATYFYWEPVFRNEFLVTGAIVFAGNVIRIEVDGNPASIGQICYGVQQKIGDSLVGTKFSYRDFSTRETDSFGNLILVPRNFVFEVEFSVLIDRTQVRRIQRLVAQQGNTLTAYWTDENQIQEFGLFFGLPNQDGLVIPVGEGTFTTGTCKIEGYNNA